MEFESSVMINRPAAEVFDLVGNPDRDMEWGTLIEESTRATAGALSVGSVFQQKAVFLGIRASIQIEVTEYEPNTLIGYEVVEPLTAQHRRVLEETPEGTRLTFSVQLDPPKQYQIGVAVMRRRAQRQMENDMNHIKEMLESAPNGVTMPSNL